MSTLRSNFYVRMAKRVAWVVLAIVTGLFPIAGILAVKHQHRYRDVKTWIEVSAEVFIKAEDRFEESNSKMSGYVVNRYKWISANYTYAVKGVSYQGHEVSAHGPVLHTELPEHPTTVFYNPANPEDAVLVRELSEDSLEIVLLWGFCAVILTVCYLWLKDFRKKKRGKARDLHWAASKAGTKPSLPGGTERSHEPNAAR